MNLVFSGDVNLPCISWLTKIVFNIFLEYSNLKLFNGDVKLPCMVSKESVIFLKSVNLVFSGDVILPCISWLTKTVIFSSSL